MKQAETPSVRELAQSDCAQVQSIFDAASQSVNIETESASPWIAIWVAEFADEGLCAAMITRRAGNTLEVLNLATHPSARRRGAARALLLSAIEQASRAGVESVHLEVRWSNRAAIRLYESFGFEQTRLRRAYYADGEDGVEMLKVLAG